MYRQVNAGFEEPYRLLIASGLYDDLVGDGLMVSHEEVTLRLPDAPPAQAVLRPDRIPFVSYPYEWCFGQLKAAALLTLELQRRALAKGLVLRDASAFNVQFVGTRPIFIDTLSFGPYREGKPWAGYRQFCQHFLAPLALRAHAHHSLGDLARVHIDGVPLELTSRLLPMHARLRPGLLMHLLLHGRMAGSAADDGSTAASAKGMSLRAMLGLTDSLERTVRRLSWTPPATLWSTYASHHSYSEAAQADKLRLVADMIAAVAKESTVRTIWDVGANTGAYSRLAAESGAYVVSFDGDQASVERHYRDAQQFARAVLPLVQDFTNPSGGAGWLNLERQSLLERGPADLVMALALVHHLTIGGNVPLPSVAAFFAQAGRHLIVEFVPREDSQVQRMLALRENVCCEYTREAFEQAFGQRFRVLRRTGIEGTVRTLYLMERR